jgi:hypothetical protein
MAEEEKKSVPFYKNPNFWKTMERIGTVVSTGAILFAPEATLVYKIGCLIAIAVGGNWANEIKNVVIKAKK